MRTWIATVLVAALGFHAAAFLLYAPGDVYSFVRPWFRELASDGFARPIGNYAPPYLYLLWGMTLFDGLLWQVALIKLLSVGGGCWTAFAASRVLQAVGRPRVLALIVLALPSVILNTSLLGQADTFWVAPCLLAMAAAIERRFVAVGVWAGLGFAFKMQAAVLSPFLIYLFVRRSAPIKAWLAAPVAFSVAWAPALIMGWPLSYLATIYLYQFQWAGGISSAYVGRSNVTTLVSFLGNGASIWTPLGYLARDAAFSMRWWVGAPALALGLAAYWRRMPKAPNTQQMLLAAALCSIGVPFVLPGMLDRFFILGELLTLLLALCYPTRGTIVAASVMVLASGLPTFFWAFRMPPWESVASIFAAAALLYLWRAVMADQTSGEVSGRIITTPNPA